MRDYENAPYMRVSTDSPRQQQQQQQSLVDLTAEDLDVHRKLLENAKDSITKYEVISREEIGGHPVSRVALTSISGRMHQLNVHCAAFGHPIVGDRTYGLGGDASQNGGLSDEELERLAYNPGRASVELLEKIAVATSDMTMCVHAKSISFIHPETDELVSLSSDAPF